MAIPKSLLRTNRYKHLAKLQEKPKLTKEEMRARDEKEKEEARERARLQKEAEEIAEKSKNFIIDPAEAEAMAYQVVINKVWKQAHAIDRAFNKRKEGNK